MKLNQPVFDSHCHIDLLFDKGIKIDDIEKNAVENNLTDVIQVAAHPESYTFSRDLSKSISAFNLYYTIGAHPNEVGESDSLAGIKFAKENNDDDLFRAIGEIGLDYFYGNEFRKQQIEVFEKYTELAVELGKPICVHTRDAHEDTIAILKNISGKVPILIHCFTGNREQMEEYLNLAAYISFSGIVTFKNAEELRKAAVACPQNRILAETDSPYLTPVPKRGKTNMPGWVRYVVEFLEQLSGNENLPEAIYKNTAEFYSINI